MNEICFDSQMIGNKMNYFNKFSTLELLLETDRELNVMISIFKLLIQVYFQIYACMYPCMSSIILL